MRTAVVAVLAFALTGVARADVVHLKAGGKLEGEIVRDNKDEVELRLPYGSMVVKRSEIARIEKKLTPDQELARRREGLGPKDAAGRVELARFALDHRVTRAQDTAAELAVAAFRIDPANQDAVALLKKLDHRYDVEHDAWVAPATWYPANGWVRRDAKWITVEDAAALDAGAAARQGKSDVLLAESALRAGQDAIARAQQEETALLQQVRAVEADLASLRAKTEAAKLDLAARENDLAAASQKVATARSTVDLLVAQPRPKDQAACQDLDRRISSARWNQAAAEKEERRAREARDCALEEVKRLLDLEANGPQKIASLRSQADAARQRGVTKQGELPALQAAIDKARARALELEEAERKAKLAAVARRLKERKDEDARDAALRLKAGRG